MMSFGYVPKWVIPTHGHFNAEIMFRHEFWVIDLSNRGHIYVYIQPSTVVFFFLSFWLSKKGEDNFYYIPLLNCYWIGGYTSWLIWGLSDINQKKMGLDRGIFMVSKKGILPIKSFRYRNGYNNHQKWGLKLCQTVVRIRRLWKPSVFFFVPW